MNKKIFFSVVFLSLFVGAIVSTPLEARHRGGFGFSFSTGFAPARPVYAVPVAKPVYVPSYPNCYEQYVVYPAPVAYYPPTPSFGFGWDASFWR